VISRLPGIGLRLETLLKSRYRSIGSRQRGAIAQLGERVVRNDEAVGSIPTSSTKFSITCSFSTTQLCPKLVQYFNQMAAGICLNKSRRTSVILLTPASQIGIENVSGDGHLKPSLVFAVERGSLKHESNQPPITRIATALHNLATPEEKPLLDRVLRVKRSNQLKRYGAGEVERKEAEAAR